VKPSEYVCDNCGKIGQLSAPVASIMVWMTKLPRPFVMLPEEEDEYRICMGCNSINTLVEKAVAGCGRLEFAGRWVRSVVVFDDGSGIDCTDGPSPGGPTQKEASA
jgi:RNA polymerase subunit RPABC4/transcription elongation factor Spt4